ncbi:MAG: amidohydrolase family protein [Candidatus Thermoplasmatota archaeon]|nr:amidohydrolase family protein [Candidatus Thermoplasmatota archaeon]MCL5730982.1 amidohydrolase family protein [Candidatus Thermoplasmatota archaeon]
MKTVLAKVLYDGVSELRNVYISFDDRIRYIGENKPDDAELIAEGVVTPAFIDGHSHIGMVRAGEPSAEEESNETMESIYPIVNALHSVYMDDGAFRDSVESGVLYSVVLPGSGNPIGGKAVLLRNYAGNVSEAYMMDIGVKAALGYNPRSTKEWEGKRPTTRMGAVGMLRENFIRARNVSNLVRNGKKDVEEIEPITKVFMDILSGKYRMMVHLHREDDLMVLFSLVDEFGLKAIVNHALDFYRVEPFAEMKRRGIPLVYGPMDAHPYKVELKHESWRNAGNVIESGVEFCLMSDHPVILQRNLFLTVRHFLRFGMSRNEAISHLTSIPARILNIQDLGRLDTGYIPSMVVWSSDPFSLESHPKMVIGEGKVLYEE